MDKDKSSRSVYSTSVGRLCPNCEYPKAKCICSSQTKFTNHPNSTVYLHRERKGRGGKEVTIIKQLPLNQIALKLMAKELKSKCGSGGTVSNGHIEIQGDRRDVLKNILESKGYLVKLSGS